MIGSSEVLELVWVSFQFVFSQIFNESAVYPRCFESAVFYVSKMLAAWNR